MSNQYKYSSEISDTDPENPPIESFSISTTAKSSVLRGKFRGKQYIGKNIPLRWNGSKLALSIGPDWPFLLGLWSFLVVIGFTVFYFVAMKQSFIVKVMALGVTLWEAFIYLLTALKNPGLATSDTVDQDQLEEYQGNPDFCATCNVLRDDDTEHCEDCDVCIRGFDHHCPWTGKCIGAGNLMPFYSFLTSTVIYMVVLMLILFGAL